MDFFLLTLISATGFYMLKSAEQRKRITLLGSHLSQYQIEKLMETLSDGYLRALGEKDAARREQVWALLASSVVVWLAPYGEVAGDVASGRLVELTVETSEALSAVGLARRVDSEPSPSASMLMAILREVAGEVRASTSR